MGKCKEEELWDAVCKWVTYQCEHRNVDETDDDCKGNEEDKVKEFRMNLLKSVKHLMRFGLMKSVYFCKKVEPEKILDDKELIAVLMYFQIPSRGCGAFNVKRRYN